MGSTCSCTVASTASGESQSGAEAGDDGETGSPVDAAVQLALDAEDEALMKTALDLYADERAARERRVEILERQRTLLVELSGLVEDTRGFNGHATFAKNGFAEGLSY